MITMLLLSLSQYYKKCKEERYYLKVQTCEFKKFIPCEKDPWWVYCKIYTPINIGQAQCMSNTVQPIL